MLLLANFTDVVLQVVEEELHHVQLLLRPPATHTHTHISTLPRQSVTVTTGGSHGDPVGVVAGAELLEGAEEFGQQPQGHHHGPEGEERRWSGAGSLATGGRSGCSYWW